MEDKRDRGRGPTLPKEMHVPHSVAQLASNLCDHTCRLLIDAETSHAL